MIDIEEAYQNALTIPSDINEHVATLRRLASHCSHVTEFGVRSGNSTRALIAARPGRLVSYDVREDPYIRHIFSQEEDAGFLYDYLIEDVLTVEIEPTDMLFIDTWHVYQQLIQELSLHAGKVSKYIVMHDTETYGLAGEAIPGRDEPEGGLLQAIGEFLVHNLDWTVLFHYPNNNGLTVLAKRVETPEVLEPEKPLTWREQRGL